MERGQLGIPGRIIMWRLGKGTHKRAREDGNIGDVDLGTKNKETYASINLNIMYRL